MKRIMLSIVAMCLFAGLGYGAVTQTAGAVAKHLPETNDQFKDQINNAMYDLTQTDVPAIITDLNAALATNTVSTAAIAANATAIGLGATTNTTQTAGIAANVTAIGLGATTNTTQTAGIAANVTAISNGATTNNTQTTGIANNVTAIGNGATTNTTQTAAIGANTTWRDGNLWDNAAGGINITAFNGGITNGTNLVVLGTLTANSRYATVGPDTTTTLMVQTGKNTNGQSVVFSPVFAATPKVIMGYAESPASATNFAFYTSLTPTSFVCNGKADINIDWVAIGAR